MEWITKRFQFSSVDYANNSLFVVNGPVNVDRRDVAGYIFDMNTNEVSGKFGTFIDPHDLTVTSDAREVSGIYIRILFCFLIILNSCPYNQSILIHNFHTRRFMLVICQPIRLVTESINMYLMVSNRR